MLSKGYVWLKLCESGAAAIHVYNILGSIEFNRGLMPGQLGDSSLGG